MTSKISPDDLSREEIDKLLELKKSMASLQLDMENPSAMEICRLFGITCKGRTDQEERSTEDSMDFDSGTQNYRIPKNQNNIGSGSSMDYISPLAKVGNDTADRQENSDLLNKKFCGVRGD